MDKKKLNPPSLFSSSKGTAHSGLIPPSHFEARCCTSAHPPSVPAPPPPPPSTLPLVPTLPLVSEHWVDFATELARLKLENEELRKNQERGQGARARSLDRQLPDAPHSESRALEIIAHQLHEIQRLEQIAADAQGKEEELQRLSRELQELKRSNIESEQAEERRRRAEEVAARQRQEELRMMSERHKVESDTLRCQAQTLEAELRDGLGQWKQEVTQLREELGTANQDKDLLSAELSQCRVALESQNSLVQQLRTYIGELVPDHRQLEEQRREKLEFQGTIEALQKERDALQSSASLLNTRLSSLTNILSLQEGELCKKLVAGEGETSRLLLSRWREKVFTLMVQMKSEEINQANDSRKVHEKICSLKNALEESAQQQSLLTHSLRDRTAELDIERVRNKSLRDELSAEQSTSAHLRGRAEEGERAVRHVKQLVEDFVQALSAQEVSQRAALSRLATLGQRVSFATTRVDSIQGLVAQKLALMRLSQEEKPRDAVTDIFRPSYEDLEKEVALLNQERDRLSAELKRSALVVERKVTETRERMEAELAECHHTASLLRQSLHETQERERVLREQAEEMEKRLQQAEDSMLKLREELVEQQGEYEKALQGRVREVEAQMLEQLAQMEKHLHEARREHTKAVVALRQSERQAQREKTRSQETARATEDAARTREEQLSRQLQEAERDKNLMMATLRQEGLLSTYQKNRSAALQATKRGLAQGRSLADTQPSATTSSLAAKDSISLMLDNLQSLGHDIMKDDDDEEEEEDLHPVP